ncbi:MAG: hypothetical protein IKB16_00425 [Lentisphaeria bacterium]|nr:hypothetical protein [Lentisphaeria bacterium]
MPVQKLYNTLFEHYGPQHWWPCQTGKRWEIITGAVLTQNTAWTNVEKAISNLIAVDIMSPEKVLAVPDSELQELIRPAGFFTQKSAYLKEMAQFIREQEKHFIMSDDVWDLRNQLLARKGVGRETADSILLYAFDKPVFVIDAYTRRVGERHLGLNGKAAYDVLQKIFMDALGTDRKVYNEYHALIVRLCKESCKKSQCGTLCKELFS